MPPSKENGYPADIVIEKQTQPAPYNHTKKDREISYQCALKVAGHAMQKYADSPEDWFRLTSEYASKLTKGILAQ